MYCKNIGMLLISNKKPDSKYDGKNEINDASEMAINWFFAALEMRIPIASDIIKYRLDPKSRIKTFPLIGTPKTYRAIARAINSPIIPRQKLIIIFARIISVDFIGVTNRLSMLPCSYSRAMTIEVSRQPIIVRITTIIPGMIV